MSRTGHVHRAYLIGHISEETATALVKELYEIDERYPESDIELVINSQGGNIIDGLSVYSTLVELSERGNGKHFITTKVRGMAGSMATVILQAGDWRVSGEFDVTIWHEAKMSFDADFVSTIKRDVAVWEYQDAMLSGLVQQRAGLTDEECKALHGPVDRLVFAKEALALNLIDAIA
ncbi:ATP-dependent Clp protease proteolytic subunit [Mycobacterium sp. AZCC_0083]|uniref:ATP-dependent Clp protease proteolytic subunit n=1 Tax=Mycobacterium sp. AZCC_0083 TaxID=2735882 RepID=UPI00160A1E90|nr:ATP-dependent Clp protease proteolytic subunit [Mycobacterium sp. AZCC_0083]MBB5167164.1 ATP-dependent protease ClpP protease subunit [Mycobacterium sp. AZCC_0083]